MNYNWTKSDTKKPTKRYIIEVEKKIICFGTPGTIYRWEYYMGFDTAEERDAQYEWLQEYSFNDENYRVRVLDPYDDIIHRRYTDT